MVDTGQFAGPQAQVELNVDWTERFFLATVAALLAFQMFVPPVVGLANNGDFSKLLGRYSLGAPTGDEYLYAPTRYTVDAKYHWDAPFHSSASLLIAAALGLNLVTSRDGSFDLRWMGLVHAALWLLALGLLLPATRELGRIRRVVLLAALIFVFCDTFYAAYLNSFYMDAAAVVFLALAIAFLIRSLERDTAAYRVGFLVCCALFLTAKTQHSMLGLPVAALILARGSVFWPRSRRWFRVGAAVVVLSAAIVGWRATPPEYKAYGLYSVIFAAVLPHSTDIPADLKELGLDDSYQQYVGTQAYSEGSPTGDAAFIRRFNAATSFYRVVRFLAKRPPVAWQVAAARLNEGGRQRPPMGNFDRSAARPERAESQAFAIWSGMKRHIFEGHASRYLFSFLALGIALCGTTLLAARAGLRAAAPVCALVLMAGMELMVACLADSGEATRHFFLFNALMDVLLVIFSALLLGGVRRSR